MNELCDDRRWLLLIHQIPPKPAYFRVKVWRRLQTMGAVAIKNSVYVAPKTDQTQEDFEWLLREIVDGGGDASLCEARFIEGLQDEHVEALFNAAREADYRQVADEARAIAERSPAAGSGLAADAEIERLRRRLRAIGDIDFFGAPGREIAEGLVGDLERQLRAPIEAVTRGAAPERYRGRTWVTRKGVHIDRIASAWLVRRFVDPDAEFKFVPARGYRPESGELRFDMFEAEFTHDGDRCTFEVIIARFGLDDPALRPLGEIVHDIDLKDAKFGRPELAGVDALITGVATAHRDDEQRLARGGAVFDALYEYFRRKHR
ncbi:MAG TPA: chromate resistance protein ChrB domain-containing protein [Candidatus Binatia bacterium]|nr:chromate resistance protein ChrB domain-containing protein [Candidatus Binatia bacterium]